MSSLPVAAAQEPDGAVPNLAVRQLVRSEVQRQRDAALGQVLQLELSLLHPHVPVRVDVQVLEYPKQGKQDTFGRRQYSNTMRLHQPYKNATKHVGFREHRQQTGGKGLKEKGVIILC